MGCFSSPKIIDLYELPHTTPIHRSLLDFNCAPFYCTRANQFTHHITPNWKMFFARHFPFDLYLNEKAMKSFCPSHYPHSIAPRLIAFKSHLLFSSLGQCIQKMQMALPIVLFNQRFIKSRKHHKHFMMATEEIRSVCKHNHWRIWIVRFPKEIQSNANATQNVGRHFSVLTSMHPIY